MMMEAAFLQALHADPTDEATWLALADWLEEGSRRAAGTTTWASAWPPFGKGEPACGQGGEHRRVPGRQQQRAWWPDAYGGWGSRAARRAGRMANVPGGEVHDRVGMVDLPEPA
jgi:uncharacterized protein (TIGR02996 family)